MARLILIRHTSVAIPRGVCYGQSDVPLADSFAEEALCVRQELESLGLTPEGMRVYSSPMSRCIRLAEFCGYGDHIERDSRLMELNFGQWELQAFDAIEDPRLEEWYRDYIYTAPTGGESFAEQYERVASFLEEKRTEALSTGGNILAFTHSGVLRSAAVWQGRYSLEQAFDYACSYGQIEVIPL